ncbi:solute carrier family 13 member 1-like isoform X2 [Lethenteron reissneri]|nr:solute carrier family 13 member 1-like isoform X2 [Lethenteron reissneri]
MEQRDADSHGKMEAEKPRYNTTTNNTKTAVEFLKTYKKLLIVVLVPLLALPLPIALPYSEAHCGYVLIITAVFWITEALPLPVTGFVPLFLFPLLGVAKSGDVAMQYFKDATFLYLGVMFIAAAIEYWNLHRRIALRMIMLVGLRPIWLMLGFMGTSAFLSMWINNSSTTAMMIPIVEAVLTTLLGAKESVAKGCEDGATHESSGDDKKDAEPLPAKEDVATQGDFNVYEVSTSDVDDDDADGGAAGGVVVVDKDLEADTNAASKESRRDDLMARGLSLSIAYAANIGGVATLTGTSTNLVFVEQMEQKYPDCNCINFGSWMAFALPCAIIFVFIAWFWIAWMFVGFQDLFSCKKKRTSNEKRAEKLIRREYEKLGNTSYPEACVLFVFVLMALLWLTKDPGFMPGWATIFGHYKSFVSDTTVAVTVGFLLFVWPSHTPSCIQHYFPGPPIDPDKPPVIHPATLMDWKTFNRGMSWGVCFLIGGGFALAEGAEVSGLSTWMAAQLEPLKVLPGWAISIICSMLICAFTQCASNLATVTLFLPILSSLAEAISVNPIYLMLPATMCATFAFVLPVATPPNAIVFSYGRIKVMDMVKSGVVLSFLGVGLVAMAMNTWGVPLFDVLNYPDWAPNRTQPSPSLTTITPTSLFHL